jgi:hypothetical protein
MKISRRQPSLEPDEHGMIYAWKTQGLDGKKRLNRPVDQRGGQLAGLAGRTAGYRRAGPPRPNRCAGR